jgi:hypothetical protein
LFWFTYFDAFLGVILTIFQWFWNFKAKQITSKILNFNPQTARSSIKLMENVGGEARQPLQGGRKVLNPLLSYTTPWNCPQTIRLPHLAVGIIKRPPRWFASASARVYAPVHRLSSRNSESKIVFRWKLQGATCSASWVCAIAWLPPKPDCLGIGNRKSSMPLSHWMDEDVFQHRSCHGRKRLKWRVDCFIMRADVQPASPCTALQSWMVNTSEFTLDRIRKIQAESMREEQEETVGVTQAFNRRQA